MVLRYASIPLGYRLLKTVLLTGIGEGVLAGIFFVVLRFHWIAPVGAAIICFVSNLLGYGLLRLLFPKGANVRSRLIVIAVILGCLLGLLSAVTFSLIIEVHPVVTVPFGVAVGAFLGLANALSWRNTGRV